MSILGNILWKAVFQNCKVIPDAIWGRGNIINRQVGKMYLIKTIKGDITKEKGKHDEHI